MTLMKLDERSLGRRGDTVLVTGSSTGLGLETALYLAERGFKVFATVRDLASRPDVARAASERRVSLEVLRLDVTDSGSIEDAVGSVVEAGGGIFGLVSNAGIGLRGCLEDLEDAEIRQVFETNVFGTMALTKRVLPHMRAAGRGRIVTIASVGGKISSFGMSAYCATKFALEGFGEALALEVAPFGLQAILIEPGIIKTSRWTVNRGRAANALNPASPYYELFQRSEEAADGVVKATRNQPVHVAKAVYHALTTPHPRMHYVVGWPASAAVRLRRYLPEALFERLYFGGLLRRIVKNAAPAGAAVAQGRAGP